MHMACQLIQLQCENRNKKAICYLPTSQGSKAPALINSFSQCGHYGPIDVILGLIFSWLHHGSSILDITSLHNNTKKSICAFLRISETPV